MACHYTLNNICTYHCQFLLILAIRMYFVYNYCEPLATARLPS
jgi:hypothetical protein